MTASLGQSGTISTIRPNYQQQSLSPVTISDRRGSIEAIILFRLVTSGRHARSDVIYPPGDGDHSKDRALISSQRL